MRTVAQKPKVPQQPAPAKSATIGQPHRAQSSQAHPILHLHLHRTIGNQAAQRFLLAHAQESKRHSDTATATRVGRDFSPLPVHAPGPIRMQPKLAVNIPGDVYEQQADYVAEQVMRMPEPTAVELPAPSTSLAGVQRTCACGGTCSSCQGGQSNHEHEHLQMKTAAPNAPVGIPAPPIVHQLLRSPGQPLDPATRAFMEPRFARDFSHVRVHTGAVAEESAKQINARAYTVGQDIVFGDGRYTPGTQSGRGLIAHELTHVVQQVGQQGAQQNVAQDQALQATVQRQPAKLSESECKTCPHPMSGSATSSFPDARAGLLDWVKEEAWDATVGHDRPVLIYRLLQRHDDQALDALWRFHIATSEWAGGPGAGWTKIVEELNERATGLLVAEIKQTLLSHAVIGGSAFVGDKESVTRIEDSPDQEGTRLAVGMGAQDVIKPTRELAGLRVVSANSDGFYYEVIGHENIYFWISEYNLRVKGGTAGLIAKEASKGPDLFAQFWDAVGKFSKGVLTAIASPVEMIVDTAAKIVDMLSLYAAKRAKKDYGVDLPYTCISSTCKEAEACLDRGTDLHDCQTTALKQAAESATIVIPMYRQGRDCLRGDYEACGSIAPVLLGLLPKGGRALKTAELEKAPSGGAVKVEEAATRALESTKPLTQAEFEEAAIREGIGRPRTGDPHIGQALEKPKVHEEPPAPKARAPKSEQWAKLHEKDVQEFASRFQINSNRLQAELAELSKDASDPAKVSVPEDPNYDAEMTASENGETHKFERERSGTKRWCRFSEPPGKCGVPVGADFDAKVDESLHENKGKAADPADEAQPEPARQPAVPPSSTKSSGPMRKPPGRGPRRATSGTAKTQKPLKESTPVVETLPRSTVPMTDFEPAPPGHYIVRKPPSAETQRQIVARAGHTTDGRLRDANTGRALNEGEGVWGHDPYYQFKEMRDMAEKLHWTQQEFDAFFEDPAKWQIEFGPTNSGRTFDRVPRGRPVH